MRLSLQTRLSLSYLALVLIAGSSIAEQLKNIVNKSTCANSSPGTGASLLYLAFSLQFDIMMIEIDCV